MTVRIRRAAPTNALLAWVLLIAACGSGPVSSPTTAAPSSAPTAAGTSSPSTGPATAGVRAPCAVQVGDTCPMPPGIYHSQPFSGGVTFEIFDVGWTNEANESDVVSSSRGTRNWFVIVSGPPVMGEGDFLLAVSEPEDAMAILEEMVGMSVTPVEAATTIDGHPAVVFDVTNTGAETIALWYYPTSDAHYVLDPGVVTRLHWLSIDDVPTLVAVEAPAGTFESFYAEMQRTLESLAFG